MGVNSLNLCILFQGIIIPLAKSCCFLQTLPGGLCFITVSLSDANKFYLYSFMPVSLYLEKQTVLLVKNLSGAKKERKPRSQSFIVITCHHGVSLL